MLSVEQDVWQATSAKIMAEYDGWSAAINYASAVDNLMTLIGVEKRCRKITRFELKSRAFLREINLKIMGEISGIATSIWWTYPQESEHLQGEKYE